MSTSRRAFLHWVATAAGAAPVVLTSGAERLAARQVDVPHEFDISLDSIAVAFRSGSVMSMGYLSQPRMEGAYPGVIVVHDESGLTTHTQGTTRQVATAGYVALAPDFLSPLGTASFRGVETDVKRAVTSIGEQTVAGLGGGAIAYLKSMKLDGNRIGAVGFGWGGGAALTCASSHPEIAACVVFNSQIPQPVNSLHKLKAPVLAIFAGDDKEVAPGIAPFEAALTQQKHAHTIKVIPGVQRGFHDPASGKLYNAPAAKEAWALVLQHLEIHLKGSGA